MMNAREVRFTAALRMEASTRSQRYEKTCKEAIVIEHPVKGGGTEYDVEALAKREGRDVGQRHEDSIGRRRKILARPSIDEYVAEYAFVSNGVSARHVQRLPGFQVGTVDIPAIRTDGKRAISVSGRGRSRLRLLTDPR